MFAGKYYYYELLYVVTKAKSFMKSGVEISNTDTQFLNTVPEIQNVSVRATIDP